MGGAVKGLTKVHVDRIHGLCLIHYVSHLVVEGDQVSQAGPYFHKPVLAGPDPLVVLYMPRDGTRDDLLHNLPQHQGQADSPVVPQILLPALIVDGNHTGQPPVCWDLCSLVGLLIK